MALPEYVDGAHHVGLKASGADDFFGFMLEGGYSKEVQRESLSQGGLEFGGQGDLIGQSPSLSRWTQDDFIGGMYGFQWGRDDAMFADCTGFMPSQQSRSLFSCPPMVQKATGLTGTARSMFMVGGSIYVCTNGALYRLQIGSWTLDTYTLPGSDTFVFAEYDSQDQKIWTGNHVPGSIPLIRRINTDLTDPSVDNVLFGPQVADGWSFINGTIYNQFVVCQFGRKLFIGDPPDNHEASVNGKIKWRKVTRLPGRWKDSVAWNNTLYILVNDGSFKSHIFAFDGESCTAICTFPFNFYAKCIIEYAGRLFVGGTGTDVNGGEHYAELYEVTGASVRLVRTFSPETRTHLLGGIEGEWPQSIDDLTIHEGLLWICQKGKRVIGYDVTSDGFFGAAEIQGDSTRNYSKFVSGRGRLWALTSDGEIDRIAQPADAVSSWNPTLVTSDFAHEIASVKRWSEIQIHSKYGQVESLEYSVNSGATWTDISAGLVVTQPTGGQVYFSKVDLSGIAASKIIRFRVKLTDTGDAGDAITWHRELIAFTVAFSMSSETKKMAYAITINGSALIETLAAEFNEATAQAYTPSEVRDQLWAWMEAETSLVFKDPAGDEVNVKIEAMREVMPVIGPKEPATTGEPEAHFALTLLEV